MKLSEKKQGKLNFAKQVLDGQKIIYMELRNGQLQIDTVNFWATTGKWYDTETGKKGKGINNLVQHLKEED